MIIFNEGTPGSGKSYDAIATHLVPALAKRRRVFARINGLNRDAIAAYINANTRQEKGAITVEHLEVLLVELSEDDVRALHERTDLNGALVIVDEAHEFWVADKKPLAPEVENFFAKHRHHGCDILLISQFYKRIHLAVRSRVERKAVFTKQSAIGLDSKYQVRYYAAIMPDKYEKTTAELKSYDKAIFPLYQSVEPGTENLEVYKGGARSAWRSVLIPALIVIPMGIFGVLYLISFFTGGVEIVETTKPAHVAQENAAPQRGAGMPTTATPVAIEVPEKRRPAGAQYVFELSAKARPRVSGELYSERRSLAIVEWRDEQSKVTERLTTDELRDLGMTIKRTQYGMLLVHDGEAIVATRYPLDHSYSRIAARPEDGSSFGANRSLASFASNRTSSRPAPQSALAGSSRSSASEPLQWKKDALP